MKPNYLQGCAARALREKNLSEHNVEQQQQPKKPNKILVSIRRVMGTREKASFDLMCIHLKCCVKSQSPDHEKDLKGGSIRSISCKDIIKCWILKTLFSLENRKEEEGGLCWKSANSGRWWTTVTQT